MQSATRRLSIYLFSLAAFFLFAAKVFAAACCGGGLAAPALIIGDDRAQVTTSYSYAKVDSDVGADGLWSKREVSEITQTVRLEGAMIFHDRFQAGLSVPFIERARGDYSSRGLGDVTANLGFEYLTDWDYNPWRPRGLGYLQIVLPSGRSIFEAEDSFQLEARGRGFWAVGLGTVLSKTFGSWDTFGQVEVHRSFSRDFSSSQTRGRLNPGFGRNISVGAGYNLRLFRFGGSMQWTHEDPISVTGTISSQGSSQKYVTGAISVSYIARDQWSVVATYADQTFFGEPANTSLSRSLMVHLQHHLLR